MYTKNLTQDLRLRLSEKDFQFLVELSNDRGSTISDVIRSIIGEYRRGCDTINALNKAIELVKKGEVDGHGDSQTDLNNLV